MAKLVLKIAESNVGIEYEPQPPFMMNLGLPALDKAREKLGWVPLMRLEDGLKKTVDYVRANKLLLTNGA